MTAGILYCHCKYAQVVSSKVKEEVLDRLSASRRDFDVVPDLCELSARKDPKLRELSAGGAVKIAACYPRAVRWLFSAAAAPLPENARVLNMRTDPAETILQEMLKEDAVAEEASMTAPGDASLRVVLYEGGGSRPLADADRTAILRNLLESGYAVSSRRADGGVSGLASGTLLVLGRFLGERPAIATDMSGQVQVLFRDIEGVEAASVPPLVESIREEAQVPEPGAWHPWFPVIDYSRCTNCLQCLSFCLFDVYGVSPEGKIEVRNQDHCKTNCPACSRVCPEVAIMFPKYRHGPIHGGEIGADDLRRESMKADISALLGGDIDRTLRDRGERTRSRFSEERDEEWALKERRRCLTRLNERMDIPREVLQSLPSQQEILARAAAAKERARQALQQAPPKTD